MHIARILGRCRYCWAKLRVCQLIGGRTTALCPRCDEAPPAGRRFYLPSQLDA